MAPFRKILVAVDFSPHSDEALRVARELAKAFDASLTLVNVFSPPIYPLADGAYMMYPGAYAEVLAASSKRIDELAAVLRDGGSPVETKVCEGVAFREIVGFARSGGFDLIVMGTHGRTGIKHALLGSVAEKVVRKAPCAVLTVRLSTQRFEHPAQETP